MDLRRIPDELIKLICFVFRFFTNDIFTVLFLFAVDLFLIEVDESRRFGKDGFPLLSFFFLLPLFFSYPLLFLF